MAARTQHNYSRSKKNAPKNKAPVLGDNVFIERDYSQGTATRFISAFPPILACRQVDDQRFQQTVETINSYFERAEAVNCGTFVEGLIGCLSCYSIYLCTVPKSYNVYREMHNFIIQENQSYYTALGLEFLDPISNGLVGVYLELKVHPNPEEQ